MLNLLLACCCSVHWNAVWIVYVTGFRVSCQQHSHLGYLNSRLVHKATLKSLVALPCLFIYLCGTTQSTVDGFS